MALQKAIDAEAAKAKEIQVAAQQIFRTTMRQIRDFILIGGTLSPFAHAIVSEDRVTSEARVPAALRETHSDPVDFLHEWMSKEIPPGCFTEDGSIPRWQEHKGLQGATEKDRMWFYMFDRKWSTQKRKTREARIEVVS